MTRIWNEQANFPQRSLSNSFAATETVELIESKFHLLAKQPEIGHKRPELAVGLQSYVVGNYVIFFLASKRPEGVDVVRVLEGHRDIASEDFKL